MKLKLITKVVDALLSLASVAEAIREKLFNKAMDLSLKHEKTAPAVDPSKLKFETKAVTPYYGPLPSYSEFSKLFHDKFVEGECLLMIDGLEDSNQLSCEDLYSLLKEIDNTENPSALMLNIYGTVMAILFESKPIDKAYLN